MTVAVVDMNRAATFRENRRSITLSLNKVLENPQPEEYSHFARATMMFVGLCMAHGQLQFPESMQEALTAKGTDSFTYAAWKFGRIKIHPLGSGYSLMNFPNADYEVMITLVSPSGDSTHVLLLQM